MHSAPIKMMIHIKNQIDDCKISDLNRFHDVNDIVHIGLQLSYKGRVI